MNSLGINKPKKDTNKDKNIKVDKPLLNMNVSYDFKKSREINNNISDESSDRSGDDTELSTPETRPTLTNNSSNQKFDIFVQTI